jgi:hypothetical protein
MVQTKALSYLENKVPTLTDVYHLSIVGYALQLAQSSQASLVWTKLDAKAKTEGNNLCNFFSHHFLLACVYTTTKFYLNLNLIPINGKKV